MNLLNHSAGLCLIDARTRADDSDYSFAVIDGEVVDCYGWGYSGAVPEVAVNPIDGPVHTVYVFDLSDDSKKAILSLAREHVSRYRQCYVECAPFDGELASWVGSGMPAPEEREEEPVAVSSGRSAWTTSTGDDQ